MRRASNAIARSDADCAMPVASERWAVAGVGSSHGARLGNGFASKDDGRAQAPAALRRGRTMAAATAMMRSNASPMGSRP